MTYTPEIVASPAEQPATDYFTGSATGPFIDTGVYAEDRQTGRRFGRIYLSKDTLLALAAMFDEPATPQTQNSDYARGYLDGTRDGLAGDLADVARALGGFLDRIEPALDPEGNRAGGPRFD